MEIIITKHAYEKLKERTNYSPTRAKEVVEEAYYCGQDPCDFQKQTRKYLENVLRRSYEEHQTDTLKVFKGDIFLFCKGYLITSFPMIKNIVKSKPRKKKTYFITDDDDFDSEEEW